MEKIKLEEFEKTAMQKILQGADPILKVLREQYENAQVLEREFSKIGFFTTYKVPESLLRTNDPANFEIVDVCGYVNGIIVVLILFVRDGAIDFLEACTFGELWPNKIKNYEVMYIIKNGKGTSKQRDMETLSKYLKKRKKLQNQEQNDK